MLICAEINILLSDIHVWLYNTTLYSWLKVLPPPPAYGLYTCENVDNYGWSLNNIAFAPLHKYLYIILSFIINSCQTYIP